MHITFLGGGNMGRALIGGLLKVGLQAQQISVIETNPETASQLKKDFAISAIASIDAMALDESKNNIVVMAVKPQDFKAAAQALSGRLQASTAPLIVSIAAGIRTGDMSRWLGQTRCVRAMPNTPALIGKGITGLFAETSVSDADRNLAEVICNALGQTVWVDQEQLLDAVTALSGSGPAYVFAFLEALQAGGERLGLDSVTARKLAYATLEGASQLANHSAENASTLREKVTSKGGTTAAALAVLKDLDWQAALERALAAAAERSKAMGDELGQE
ncbi:pyrroline-5-carboxylate reductase [Polynucleobacter paneuropaeus]|nr:pyrroline-5-carboxylate reductase [Polynucleobacter paneuropaeus]MBT8638172.1 pyrroline-5-carboxylate reductase [Polynucleobacter paneuropaeus]